MKKKLNIIAFLLIGFECAAQTDTEEKQRDLHFYNATDKWFSAWKLVSKDIYKIEKVKPVEFVFFDDKYVYSTSSVTIKNGSPVKGCNLINLKLKWKKAPHNNVLILPDQSEAPVNLMSFASEIPNSTTSYFVMPLPDFWKNAGVTSKELGLENMITGVFIHEFSHSQQMQNFGKKITAFEQVNDFGVEFNDDIVQAIFSKNTTYLNYYKEEINLLFAATNNSVLDTKSAKEGLSIIKQRQNEFFTEKYSNLTQIDNFFLTMEGLGQYSMYVWLIHPKGGNLKRETAIEGVRRGGKWWSQDEGFALFLILDELDAPQNWAKKMFGDTTENVIKMIEQLLD